MSPGNDKQQRLRSSGAAADDMGGGSCDSTKTPCAQDCEEMWKKVNEERDSILGPSNADTDARNKRISAAYAKVFKDNPSYKWIGLAAIVSRQAGCAMDHATRTIKKAESVLKANRSTLENPWAPAQAKGGAGIGTAITSEQLDSAKTAKEALGVANKEIFSDIYPSVRATQLYGYDAVEKCQTDADGNRRVSPKILSALKNLESSDPIMQRAASDKLAEYEQRDVIQNKVYSVERYRDVFEKNENYSSWRRLWIGRLFGAKPSQISLSSQCGGEEVPFDGTITDANDRVSYYHKLMNVFNSKGSSWQQQTTQSIINQGN